LKRRIKGRVKGKMRKGEREEAETGGLGYMVVER
jgi:hypothetical protein